MAGEDDPFFTPHCNERMPRCFQTLDETNVHLDSLSSKVFDVLDALDCLTEKQVLRRRSDLQPNSCNQECLPMLCLAASRFVDLHSAPALRLDMAVLGAELGAWQSAFASLQVTVNNEAEHILTRIYFFFLWIKVQTWRDEYEIAGDRFEPDYHNVVDLIERYLELDRLRDTTWPGMAAAFSFGTGLVSCICLVSIKCRTSSLRQRCVKALRSMNLQGVFDSWYLASYLQAVMDLEEQNARQIEWFPEYSDLQCYQVPEQARLLNVTMDPMLHKGDTEFYKRTSGSFVFVRHSDGPESVMGMETGSSTFSVYRPHNQ